jgi:Na+/H+ antiporter NhaD/arsenite permease-like protein
MTLPVIVFFLVYLGMALGRVPGLALDRTGIALLGIIVLIGTETMTLGEAASAVDSATIAILFALMIVSAQFEQSGFYDWIARRITGAANNPKSLLAAVIGATGLLSALFTNDVVVFALTPLLCAGILALNLDARPYLMGLAAAANAGSAATLIGNPQNILIGQSGKLDFSSYTLVALPPTLLALGIIFVVILLTWRLEPATLSSDAAPVTLDRFQFGKALLAVAGLVILFLTPLPREVSALAIAGLLLLSRRLSSREMIGAVDWHLLLLFTCLFGITEAFSRTVLAQDGLIWLEHFGLFPERISLMAPVTLAASNTIGNVPFVVLFTKLLPNIDSGALFGLAMLSTFAGNLLLTGSMCNIIVAERAALQGAKLGFMDFARSGIPITVLSMAATIGWLLFTKLMIV